MAKKTKSFSVPEDTAAVMEERQDVNWSGVVTSFLQEYVASGNGTEAAIAVRLEQVENELADARMDVERLERERERLEAVLDDKREDRRAVFEAFEDVVRQHPDPDQLTPSNGAVKAKAEKVGMSPERFLEEFREWSG